MIMSTIGIDITYTVSNVFITTNLPARHQGLAGAVINSMLFLGISFWLGIADIVVGATADRGLKTSYQSALWLGTALPAASTVIWLFMKIGYAKSDLTMEKREQMEAEERDAAAQAGGPGESGDEVRRMDTRASRASRVSRWSSRVDPQITFHP